MRGGGGGGGGGGAEDVTISIHCCRDNLCFVIVSADGRGRCGGRRDTITGRTAREKGGGGASAERGGLTEGSVAVEDSRSSVAVRSGLSGGSGQLKAHISRGAVANGLRQRAAAVADDGPIAGEAAVEGRAVVAAVDHKLRHLKACAEVQQQALGGGNSHDAGGGCCCCL